MKLNRKYTTWILTGLLGSVVFASCSRDSESTGIEYAPNMYNSDAYEAYTQLEEKDLNPYGMTMRRPVEGTIARGQMEYTMYSEGYEASSSWTSNVPATKENVAEEGAALYMTFCQHCHGKTGKNDGKVVSEGGFPPPPWEGLTADYITNLPIGKIFHSITFGKGQMGSHASQLTPSERWKIAMYVKSVNQGDAYNYSDSESVPVVESEEEGTEGDDAESTTDTAPEPEASQDNHNEGHH